MCSSLRASRLASCARLRAVPACTVLHLCEALTSLLSASQQIVSSRPEGLVPLQAESLPTPSESAGAPEHRKRQLHRKDAATPMALGLLALGLLALGLL